MVNPIPEGWNTLSPHFHVDDAERALDWYEEARGAARREVMTGPDGRVHHAEMKVGDSIFMLADEFPEKGGTSAKTLGGSPVSFWLYVEDCDAAFERAVEAGAEVVMALDDMFWGDRYGMVEDPYGLRWSFATHVEDVSPEEMERRHQAYMEEMAGE